MRCHKCNSNMIQLFIHPELLDEAIPKIENIKRWIDLFGLGIVKNALLHGYDFYLCPNNKCLSFVFIKLKTYENKTIKEINDTLVSKMKNGSIDIEQLKKDAERIG